MADVFNSAFAAEQHAQWPAGAGKFAWDPKQLHVLPSPGSGSSNGDCTDPLMEAGHRDQCLGPLPVGWEETMPSAAGEALAGAGGTKGAHLRAPKGPLVCQVEGCGHDLSVEKGYYQRYRVCEPHMKLLSLVVNGKPSRFCQQCGRFQELTEFDGSKRSCRARLLQHNARRRKRDPYDTSRKDPSNGRKSKSANPWSGSSDDAEPASRGSVDVSHGADKTMMNYSADGGVDQGFPTLSIAAAIIAPSGGVPTWPAGGASMGAAPMDAPNVGPLPSPLLRLPLSGQPLPGQPQPMQTSKPGYARWQSGGADALDHLDDVLDSILGTEMDYLEDPAMSLPSRAGDARDRLVASGVFANPALVPRAGLSAQPAPQQPDQMWMASMTSSPAQSVAMINSNTSFTSSLPSLPAAGAWQQGGMGTSAVAGDMAAQNKRALQQRQLELQVQQQRQQQLMQQQQLLQQQQFLGRPSINSGSSSIMDMYMTSNSTMGVAMSGGPASGLAGPVSGGGTAGQCSSQGFGPSSSVGVWASAHASGTPEMLSGGAMGGNMDISMGISQSPSAPPAAARPGAQSSFDLARRLVAGGGAAAQYRSEDLMVRVSIKIANCTPDQLPPDLYQRLRNLLNTADASLVQGFLRPGCTHIVLDILQSQSPTDPACHHLDGPVSLSGAALRACLGSAGSRGTVIVQTEEEISLWPAGARDSAAPLHTMPAVDLQSTFSLPSIEHVSPAVHVDADGRATLVVFGVGLVGVGVELFARIQGGYVPVAVKPLVAGGEVLPAAAHDSSLAKTAAVALRTSAALQRAGRRADDAVLVTVEGAPGTGLLLVEAQAGPLLSNWRPCLLSHNAAIAAELSAWGLAALRSGPSALASLEAFVVDFGRVLDKRCYARPAPPSVRWTSGPVSETIIEEEPAEDDDYFVDATSNSGNDEGGVTLELVCACERLLGWAADAGLPRVSSFLAAALLQYGQDAQAILEAPYADGLSVLHRCIRSGSAGVVAALDAWAASCGVKLGWSCIGALGVSPLHLAALMPRTWSPLAAVPGVRAFWAIARAPADGATPLQLQRMLLQLLPSDAAAQGLAELFVVPKSRAATGVPTSKPVEISSPLSAECRNVAAIPQGNDCQAAHVDKAPARTVPPQSNSSHESRGSFAFAQLLTTVLVAALVAALLAMRMPHAPAAVSPDGSDAVIRLADFMGSSLVKYCTSVLCVALLGVAGFLLPVKISAATLLSQVHPVSTCIPTP